MQIIFDHQAFSLQRYGGISRYFVELCNHLQLLDKNFSIYAPFHINHYLYAAHNLKHKGQYIPWNIKYINSICYQLNELLKPLLIQDAPLIMHETYYGRKNKIKADKYVLTVFDLTDEIYNVGSPGYAERAALKKYSIERADHFICISRHTQQDLIRIYNVDPAKTSVIYLAHDLPTANSSISKKDFPDNYFLYVGKRDSYKNFNLLLNAYAETSKINSKFDLVCFGGGGFTDAELAQFEKLNVLGRINYFSGDDELLAEFYRNAFAFIYPSLYEGFGLPPLEAMSVGCPVICTDRTSVPEIVADAGLYFEADSTASLIDSMSLIIDDDVLRQRYIEAGLRRASEFSWQETARQTLAIYKAL